jgi:hypothetical protein
MSLLSRAFGAAIGLDLSLGVDDLVAYPVVSQGNHPGRYREDMSSWDDDDWTGEPPEGRYDRSRADPGFWAQNRTPMSITGIGIGVALIILAIVLLL